MFFFVKEGGGKRLWGDTFHREKQESEMVALLFKMIMMLQRKEGNINLILKVNHKSIKI